MAEMEDTGTSSTVVPDNSPGVSNSSDGQISPDGLNSSDAPNNTSTSTTVVPDNSPGVSNSSDGQNSPDSPNSSDAPNSQESPLDYVIGIENQEPLDILDPD
jgi:hypothetical protein